MLENDIKDFWAPLFLFVSFFTIEVFLKPTEATLTMLSFLILGIIFALRTHENEPRVFLLGLVIGLFIEVVLGFIARQQYWTNASLMGVPVWLPVAWGIGFVVITRIGLKIEGAKWNNEK